MSHNPWDDDVYTGNLDWALWRRIIGHARPYMHSIMVLVFNGFVIAAIDVLFPLITGKLIDEADQHGLTNTLYTYGAAYAGLCVLFALSVWWFIAAAGRMATGVAYDLRLGAFRQLQKQSFGYFDVRPIGWLVSRLTSDCSKVSSLMPWFLLDMVWGTLTIAGIIVVMFWLDVQLALAVLVIIPPLALVTVFFQKRLLESSRLIRRTNSQMTASYNECIQGVRTTKALVREYANLGEFQEQSTSMEHHSMRNALQSAVYLPAIIVLGSIGVGMALWHGGVDVEGATGITLGTLVAFMQYAGLLSMPIQELARRFTELQSAQAAAERVQGLLDTVPEIQDSPEVLSKLDANRTSASNGTAVDGGPQHIETIEFRDVTFRYTETETVLDHFNLTVKTGQTIALVGPTGGGKTTIVNLVARFYEVTEGGVFINGIDIRERSLQWLQSSLGVVLQAPHMFSGTIGENIRYGALEATDDALHEAARLAGAHAFISDLEDGYDTAVGEGGTRLSTGQRQLISLARAILADPQVFIMDEATSSVDTETEKLIQAGIEAILKGRIAFVIAHRLSTVRKADVILVIDAGKIAERGTHDELIAARGRYYELYTKQFQRERSMMMEG